MDIAECADLPAFMMTDHASTTAMVQQYDGFLLPQFRNAAAPARPGHFAEREELDAALKAGTTEALILFLERHPDSRYRVEAQDALHRLNPPPSR